MIGVRWQKVVRDITLAPVRSSVAVAAMAAGVFGVGTVLTSSSVLQRELAVTYASTQPASAILTATGLSDEVVARALTLPDVLDAEQRPTWRGRIRVGPDEWMPLVLYVVRDFTDVRIDRFERDSGTFPASPDGMVLERTALSVARARVGDRVTVRLGETPATTLRVDGTVHAPGLAPAWMDHVVYGWVTWDTVLRGSVTSDVSSLRIIVRGDRRDERHIREASARVANALVPQGVEVVRTEVPPPGRHPHADQMDAFLFLLGAFGALAFVLGAVLVATMVHALMAGEVRQIGIMQALGGSLAQLAGLYLGHVALLACAALAVGLPLGYAAGRAYADFASGILNATISSHRVPAWVVVAQIVAGMAVPIAVALGPIRHAARVSTRDALSDEPRSHARRGRPSRLAVLATRLVWLPRPWRWSLRATLEERGRLWLTVATLVAGGVVFLAALNASEAWTRLLEREAAARAYDLEVRLATPASEARVRDVLLAIPMIQSVEAASDEGATLPDVPDLRVALSSAEPDSALLRLEVIDGRWLVHGEPDGMVANTAMRASVPGLHVGSIVRVRVGDRERALTVVGIAREMLPVPTAYMPRATIATLSARAADMTRSYRVVTRDHGAGAQLAGQQAVERALDAAGMRVASVVRLLDRRQAFADHLVIIQSALIASACLVVFVGGLGLSSTLHVNVLQRTREIGLLGALGASARTLAGMVVFEGLAIGIGSWGLAMILAVPVTAAVTRVAGQIFHKAPLEPAFSVTAAFTWLALVLGLGTVASLHPAWRATRIPVTEALRHV